MKTDKLINLIKITLLLIPLLVISSQVLDINEFSYGNDEKQRIDFYKGSSDKVLVWIHGGGWLYGDKRAERWIKRFQNHFIDHQDFNVYMLGYSYNNKECEGEIPPKAIINIFGITEIKQTSEFLDKTKFFNASNYVKRWIGSDANIDQITKTLSPINILDGVNLNVLTIHGTSDRWVPYEQAVLLDEKLKDQHQLLTIDGGGHYYFSEEEDEIIRQTISSFLRSNFNMSTREQQD